MKIVVVGLTGESLFFEVRHFNRTGETVKVVSGHTEPGGKGFNQALALTCMGADVTFITAVGNDETGSSYMKKAEAKGMKTRFIVKDGSTDRAVILTDKKGDNMVIVDGRLSESVTFEEIMQYRKDIDEASVMLLQSEYSYDVTVKLIDYCHHKKIKVVFNPAPGRFLESDLLRKIDLLIPNEDEISEVTGIYGSTEKAIKKVVDAKQAAVIVTRGEKSILSFYDGVWREHPVKPVPVVDTTGAGDIFCAGVVYGLTEGLSFERSIRFATAVSGASIGKRGVIEGIPNRKETEEMFRVLRDNAE